MPAFSSFETTSAGSKSNKGVFQFGIYYKCGILTDMDSRYNYEAHLPAPEEMREELALRELENIVSLAGGELQSEEDLMPSLTERLDLPHNGVLNVLNLGAKDGKLKYVIGSASDPHTIGKRVPLISAVDQPTAYDA